MKKMLRAHSSNPCENVFSLLAIVLRALTVLLGMLFALTATGFAQAPLSFGNNFFVTGDYIVAGAYGMSTTFQTINGVNYAVGTISVPDNNNPGIQGVRQVPTGAQVVAALLYWQTVEKVGVAPGAAGSGQNGFFRPLMYAGNGGPAAPGYAISGTNVNGSSPVSWSAGGCNSGSTGKILRTYRADVTGGLPADVSGNTIANGSFEVRLPSLSTNATPLTLGATLVVIYRISSGAGGPNIPLNAIVIYDGDYAQSNTQLVMTQQLQGFYDADQSTVSRLTHIVGSGQPNKLQTVFLGNDLDSLVPLPSLYVNTPLAAFPGFYGQWDNPTWTFPSGTSPLSADSGSATTQVVPSQSNQGCVSWGAIILSTTVKSSKYDGLLDSWKIHQGYCDYLTSPSCSGPPDPGWVDLSGASTAQQDVFLQYDYMCSTVNNGVCNTGGSDYSFDPRLAVDTQDSKIPHANAMDKIVAAYANHGISLHAIPGNPIVESQPNVSCLYSDKDANNNPTCPFPNEPGTVGFGEGLAYIKNQTIDTHTGVLGCDPSLDPSCGAVFQHGKKDSYHYALFSHGVGLPNWFLADGSLSSVQQTGNTVTFTTNFPHGISQIIANPKGATATDSLCRLGRVTVIFAVTNPNLNGTYCVLSNPAPTATTFAISVGGSSTNFAYTSKTDPSLSVANGQVTSMSGYSDVGGQNSVISLGYKNWGPPNDPASDGNKWQYKSGTIIHELGHTMGLTHGGTFLNNLANNDYTPTYEANCKSNVQSSMSYLFQFDLLEVPNTFYADGNPVRVVDYSKGTLPTLTEGQPQGPGVLSNADYANTASFQLTSYAGGSPTSPHCDGTPLLQTDQPMTYVPFFSTSDFFWSDNTGLDINFNGTPNPAVPGGDVMHGHNEWEGTPADGGVGPSPGVDLQQVSAAGTMTTIGPGGEPGGIKPLGGGGIKPLGGGGGLLFSAIGGGGIKPLGGGGYKPLGGGGYKPLGGGGSSPEVTHEKANSYPRPPRTLTIVQEEVSPRKIDLSWFVPTFGQVLNYKIYRSVAGGPFALLTSVPGNQTTFHDTVQCNSGGYNYRVTALTNNDAGQQQESVPSNTVPASGQQLLTGCYVVTNFSSPASASGNTSVPITWALTDDFYATPANGWGTAGAGNPVTNRAANTLVAIGPLPKQCTKVGRTTLLLNGTAQTGMGTFANSGNQFTFAWATKPFCSGSYTFELDLDSSQTQTTAPPLVLK